MNPTPKMAHEQTCPYCGLMHSTTCPRVKAIEYHENGLTKRIEFHDVPSHDTEPRKP